MSDEAYDYGELVVLQHGDTTGPGNLTGLLDERAQRRPWRRIRLGQDELLPRLDADVRGLLVLGGLQSVTEVDEHVWMGPEIDLIASAIEDEIPVFGICLGAQLLATALGGAVTRRSEPEIALVALERTESAADDEVFAGWPDGTPMVFVHEDDVSRLPQGAEPMLQGSDGTPAWRASDGHSYGVQFHPEATPDQVASWVESEAGRAKCEAAGVDPAAFVEDVRRRERFLRANGVALVNRWIDGVVGAADPSPRKHRKAS